MPRRNVIVDKLEGTKDGQLLNDIFIERKTFYALSGIWTHVPLITGRVWSPLHYQSNHAGYTANLDSEWEYYAVLPVFLQLDDTGSTHKWWFTGGREKRRQFID